MAMQRRKTRLLIFIVCAFLGIFSGSAPAHAQAWIGEFAARISFEQRQAREASDCKFGKALEEKNVAPARNAAMLTMSSYWRAVEGGQNTPIAPFFDLRAGPIWSDRGAETIIAADSTVTDPYAKSKARIDAVPIVFIRAGDDSSAAGRWIVRNAQDELIGIYDADFKPGKTGWLLTGLSLVNKGEFLEPLVQYCNKRGDVIEARFLKLKTEFREAAAVTQKLGTQTEAGLRNSFLQREQADGAPQDRTKRLAAELAEAETERLGYMLDNAAQKAMATLKSMRELAAEEAAATSLDRIWGEIWK